MRGHGFASAARSIIEVVRLSVYLPRNARVQMNAMRMGGKPKPLSKGEIAARGKGDSYKPHSPKTWRAWEYWATRAGCGDMIGKPPKHDHWRQSAEHTKMAGREPGHLIQWGAERRIATGARSVTLPCVSRPCA